MTSPVACTFAQGARRAVWMVVLSFVATCASAAEPVWRTLPLPPALPPAAKEGIASVNGVRLHYALYGRGEPLILLHGGAGQSGHWGFQLPAFTARYQVLTIDSRGHGRSTLGAEPLSYRQMADDVVAVMDQLHIAKASVVGWSDGGIVGLDMAIRYPNRLARLVAFGANYRIDGARAETLDSPTGPAWSAVSSKEYAALSPTPDKFDAFRKALGAMYASQPNYSDAQLRAIRTPTLIAAGYFDEYYELDHTVAMARLIPDAQLAILPNASHFGVWQVPQPFNQMVLDFLAQ